MRSYKLKITSEAVQEIQQAIDYYNDARKGLGKVFTPPYKSSFRLLRSVLTPGLFVMTMFGSRYWRSSLMQPILPLTNRPVSLLSKPYSPIIKIPTPIGRKSSNPCLPA
jgi:hypothetical protein